MHPTNRLEPVAMRADQRPLGTASLPRNVRASHHLGRSGHRGLASYFLDAALLFAAFATFSSLAAGRASAEETAAADGSLSAEPYVVYVSQEQAFTRCGPSEDFYRTDPLRRGQALEVYVETADGWLGIRPPEDSFCWVPASAVELSGNSDQATVVEDHSVAWIGTHLGRARRYRWQVQLAEGEPVTIVGKSERDGPDGPQLWYRIVPPSGEFRWIHRDHVVESPEELVEKVAAIEPQPTDSEFFPERPTPRDSEPLTAQAISGRASSEGLDAVELDDVSPRIVAGGDTRRDPAQTASSRRPNRVSQPIGSFGKPDPVSTANASVQDPSGAEQPVGSGLRDEWKSTPQREMHSDQGLADNAAPRLPEPEPMQPAREATDAASVAFVGSPRLQTLGNSYETMTPAVTEFASDANWVGSGARRGLGEIPSTDAQQTIQLVGGVSGRVAPPQRSLPVVNSEAIARVEAECREATAEKLQLVLSRVMAAGGSAAETEPIARAAEQLARFAEESEARRAKSVFDRARQYQRVAQRRDGDRAVQSSTPPMIPALQASLTATTGERPAPSAPETQRLIPAVPAANAGPGDSMSETGYLVQVYSARPNSPPFALTDFSGRTLAYVTPAPGVSIRMHLNNHIRVDGTRGYVSGLDTPHVLASRAVRVAE